MLFHSATPIVAPAQEGLTTEYKIQDPESDPEPLIASDPKKEPQENDEPGGVEKKELTLTTWGGFRSVVLMGALIDTLGYTWLCYRKGRWIESTLSQGTTLTSEGGFCGIKATT